VENTFSGRKKANNEKKTKNPLGETFDLLEAVIFAFVAAVFILTLVFRTGIVSGNSMQSTMKPNDRYILSNLFYKPEVGDIIVFEPEVKVTDEKLYVKRVVATEGQTVEIKPDENGIYCLYTDGKKLEEPYLDSFQYTSPPAGYDTFEVTVPEGHVFVLGDNRVNSIDSRIIGCVDTRTMIGKVLFRFWPTSSIGVVE